MADQSVGLPDPNTLALHRIQNVLTKDGDFEYWHRPIMNTLGMYDIDKLVESFIKRPIGADETGKWWFKLSRMVRNWLSLSVHHEITEKINSRGLETSFADRFMECPRKDFRGEGPARRAEILAKLQSMKRQSYSTTKEYINDIQYWNCVGENVELGFPPYFLRAQLSTRTQCDPTPGRHHACQTQRILRPRESEPALC